MVVVPVDTEIAVVLVRVVVQPKLCMPELLLIVVCHIVLAEAAAPGPVLPVEWAVIS